MLIGIVLQDQCLFDLLKIFLNKLLQHVMYHKVLKEEVILLSKGNHKWRKIKHLLYFTLKLCETNLLWEILLWVRRCGRLLRGDTLYVFLLLPIDSEPIVLPSKSQGGKIIRDPISKSSFIESYKYNID